MRVTLETEEWSEWIKTTFAKLENVQALLQAAAQAFAFQDIIEHFRKEEGPAGKWKPRSDSTQAKYAKIQAGLWKPPRGARRGSFSPTNKLLQLTGNLRQSVLPTNVEPVGRSSLRIFANAPYSAVHDVGGRAIPARPFMWLSDTAQEKMVDAIAQMVMEETGGL